MFSRLFDIKHWRPAVIICFVVAMFATPADPVSMLLAAAGLCGLYFLGVGLRTYLHHKRGSRST